MQKCSQPFKEQIQETRQHLGVSYEDQKSCLAVARSLSSNRSLINLASPHAKVQFQVDGSEVFAIKRKLALKSDFILLTIAAAVKILNE
jgi:hypothetical protein